MIHIPKISNYKPFYIQTGSDSVAKDTTEWGLIAKTNPYPLLPEPKELYKNDWNDEHGEDEYVDHIYYKSITFEVSFYIKAYDSAEEGAEEIIRKQVESFFSKIKQGEFSIYDSYNGIGRRKVRYAGYKEEEFKKREDWARAIFTISFKVNDPITRMIIRNGIIISE